MVRKKQTLHTFQGTDISLFGISCHLKSYRLSFAMNNALNFQFRRIDDFELKTHRDNNALKFPFFVYDHSEWKNHFCLIANHHPQGKLVAGLGQVDYFLMIKNPMTLSSKKEFIDNIRKIKEVLAAYEIDPIKTKDIDMLLEEMEIHLLTFDRKK